VSTYEDGEIIQIRDKQEVSTNLKELQRGFCNYFGIGVDARICYYVELKRQKNKWLNLALYGCIGLCKLFQRIRTTR
jgi:diacylglycerol kinase family enzyme